VTYVASILPAWSAGRPLIELLMTYPEQAGIFPALTLNAPNLYQWLPDNPGSFEKPGLLLAALLAGLLCLASWRSTVSLDEDAIVKLSLVSVLLLPFTLPHMHERYFFAADVISIIYAFYTPKRFFIPLIVTTASLFSYSPFLFGEEPIGLRYLAILMGVALIIVAAGLFRTLYPDCPSPPDRSQDGSQEILHRSRRPLWSQSLKGYGRPHPLTTDVRKGVVRTVTTTPKNRSYENSYGRQRLLIGP
jgi:Gpi18-like mannosyltransferase